MSRAPLAALALAVLGFAAYRVYFAAPRPDPTTLVTLHGVALQFLTPYLPPDSLGSGDRDRVKIEAFYPDFTAAGSGSDINAKTDLALRVEKLVTLVLSPEDPNLAPEERVGKLYLRFLEDGDWSQPGGLVARDFKDDSPFAGDKIFYVPPDGREFAARCPRANSARATPNTCVYAFRANGLDVEVRFPAGLISAWRTLKSGAAGLVATARR